MTPNKKPIRIAKGAKADSGHIGARSYSFVFSDDIEDWIKSSTRSDADRARERWRKKKMSML